VLNIIPRFFILPGVRRDLSNPELLHAERKSDRYKLLNFLWIRNLMRIMLFICYWLNWYTIKFVDTIFKCTLYNFV